MLIRVYLRSSAANSLCFRLLANLDNVQEIGHLAVYLCSEEAGFITGTDIVIDDVWTAR